MPLGQQPGHLLQVLETAEERQVVARHALVLPGNQLDDRRQRSLALLVAGGYLASDAHFQLFGAKRRGHFQPGGIGRHSQQVAVEMPWAQGCGEQRHAARRLYAWAQQARRGDIAQAQGGQPPLAWPLALADVEQEVLVEQLGNPAELQRLVEELQHLRVHLRRRLVHLFLDQPDALLQGAQQSVRQRLAGLVRRALLLVEGVPLPIQPVQRTDQPGRFALAQGLQLPWSRLALYMPRPRSTRLCASSTSTATRHWLAWVRPNNKAWASK